MAALKLSNLPSSVAQYQALIRRTNPEPLPAKKCTISGSRWDSDVFIALYGLAKQNPPGYIHPTIRKFFKEAQDSLRDDRELWNALGAFRGGSSLQIPGDILAENQEARLLFAYYMALILLLGTARVVQSSPAGDRSRDPHTSTVANYIAAPAFRNDRDPLDVVMGDGDGDDDDNSDDGHDDDDDDDQDQEEEDQTSDPVFDPVQSSSTPGVPTKKTEIVAHIVGYLLAASTHSFHQMFLRQHGRVDPDDAQYMLSPKRDAHTFTLKNPAMKSNIEDDGGPEVYEIDGNGNFVKNPDIPRPWAFEFKSSVRPAEPQHLAEILKLFQQRVIAYGVKDATDLDRFPP